MNYSRVFIDSLGYELPPVVVTSNELEVRLRPVYQALRMPEGQLEALTGIVERRWWEPGYPLSQGAIAAARKALEVSNVRAEDVQVLIYAAVCREQFRTSLAPPPGGSGAVAVLVTDGSFHQPPRRRLLGGTNLADPQHHGLCQWGLKTAAALGDAVGERVLATARQFMSTDSVAV